MKTTWQWFTRSGLRIVSIAWSQAPESVAYGLLALAPLGPSLAPSAMAMALIGAIVANTIAAAAGAGRLVTAPRAALSLLAASLVAALTSYQGPGGPLSTAAVLSLLALSIAAAGGLQILLGTLGIGSIVKYTPHPVRSGLMSAVGLLLVVSARPAVLGANLGDAVRHATAVAAPGALAVAFVAMAGTYLAARWKLPVPAVLVGLLAGTALQLGLSHTGWALGPLVGVPVMTWPSLAHTPDWAWLSALLPQQSLWASMAAFAATVAALGALDTLLAISVIDGRLRRSRDPNAELRAQGAANALAGLAGGLPNSPSMVRSLALADVSAGARGGVLVYAASVLGLLLVPQVLGWLPLSAIGGVLMLQGLQAIDPWLWRTPWLLRRRRRPDGHHYDLSQRRLLRDSWVVALSVLAVSLVLGLAAAVFAGAALAVLLFVRGNMRQIVRSQRTGVHRRSLKVRPEAATAVLRTQGEHIVVLELQGALFFGTADAVRASLEALDTTVQTVVLDLFLVAEIDVTGARILLEVADHWAAQGRHLVAAEWAEGDQRRLTVEAIARSSGLPLPAFFPDLDRALEAAEDRLLAATSAASIAHSAVELEASLLARGLDASELGALKSVLETRQFAAGAPLFRRGDPGDALYLTVQGDVGIRMPGADRRLVSFPPGSMIGEMAVLGQESRSADAVAETPLTTLRLSTEALNRLRQEQPALAAKLLNNIALHLAARLRELTLDLSVWVARTASPALPPTMAPEAVYADNRGEVL